MKLQSIFFSLAAVTAFAATPLTFDPVFFTPQRAAQTRLTVSNELPALEAKLKTLKAKYQSLPEKEKYFRDRMDKRFELAERLVQMIRRELSLKENDAVFFAQLAQGDLERFLVYFRDEIALSAKRSKNETVKTFSIRDFGAKGDGKTNDFPAFLKAVEILQKTSGNKKLVIPAGTYLIDPAPKSAHIPLKNVKDTVISGNGKVRLLFANKMAMGFQMNKCENVTVENLDLRYTANLFVQGTIESIDPKTNTVVIRKDPKCADPGKGGCSPIFDPKTRRVIQDASPKFHNKCENLGNGRFRLTINASHQRTKLAGLKPGLIYVIPERRHHQRTMDFGDNRYCTIKNVTVRNSPSVGWFVVGDRSTGNNFINCRIEPDAGDYLSTSADGLHTSTQEIGPYIADCMFSGMADDCVNIKVSCYDVISIDKGRLVSPSVKATAKYLTIMDPRTGIVKMMTRPSGKPAGISVALTDPFPNTIKAANKIKKGDRADIVAVSGTIGSVITGCRFPSNRNKALILQTPNAIVSNNIISEKTCGARVGASIHWREGFPPYNVVLRNNEFHNCYSGSRFNLEIRYGVITKNYPLRYLLVENNLFDNAVLIIGNASDAVVRNNKFVKCSTPKFDVINSLLSENNTVNGKVLPSIRKQSGF